MREALSMSVTGLGRRRHSLAWDLPLSCMPQQEGSQIMAVAAAAWVSICTGPVACCREI